MSGNKNSAYTFKIALKIISTMKKTLTALTGILIFTNSFSQTLNKTDLMPQPGERYYRHALESANSINPGQAGTSAIWDLTNVTYPTENIYSYQIKNPSSTPHSVNGATYVIIDSSSNDIGYSYYKDTSTGYYLIRDYKGILEIRYSSFEFIFKFPLNYGDSVTDTYCFSSSVFSSTNYYCGNSKLKFDGIGKLLLPGKNPIDNIYRLRYESKVINQETGNSSIIVEYYWFKPGTHYPLAEYRTYTESGGFKSYNASIYDATNTSGINKIKQNNVIKIFPNPADEKVFISSDKNIDKISITDMTGHSLLTETIIPGKACSLNTRQLTNGIYFLKIEDQGVYYQQKLIVNH